MLELDVRLTKDGQVVVYHDASLLRLTGMDTSIASVDYDSLPILNETVAIDTIPGKFPVFISAEYIRPHSDNLFHRRKFFRSKVVR